MIRNDLQELTRGAWDEMEKKYKRGQHPNSRANLEANREKNRFTTETARAAQERSTKSQNHIRALRELDRLTTTDDDRRQMLEAVKRKAERGNLRAFQVYCETVGLVPGRGVDASISPEAVREVEEFLYSTTAREDTTEP